MKDLNAIVRSNDNRYFRTPDNSISFPLNLDELDYMTPIGLEHGRYAERFEYRKYEECDYPGINTLIEQGKLIECLYSEEYEVNTDKFPCRCPYKRIIEEFKANGFNVTREAIKHNYEAWSVDCKSGYRDEENNYFLFTPCGHNPLSFTATRLDEHLDWQETYGAEDMW